MVRASSRLLFLLTKPTSLLHHRPFSIFGVPRRHSLTCPLATPSAAPNHHLHISRLNSFIPIKFSENFCSTATDNTWQEHNHTPANDCHVSPSRPWPEWPRLLDSLSDAGYFDGKSNIEDEFAADKNLSTEFVAIANACLAFARDRPDILGWLPKKYIAVLIKDVNPSLFKYADETVRRMRSFLQEEESIEAKTVDLMKYLLSYAINPINNEPTEYAVRILLLDIANLSDQASKQYQQIPKYLGPSIMKKGDWICPKCKFMNFARNTKCLECEELRPADNARFTNTGQNYQNTLSPQDPDKEKKIENWFKKVKELHDSDPKTSISNVDYKMTEIPFSPKTHQESRTFVPFVPFPPNYFSKKDTNTIDKNLVQKKGSGDMDAKSAFVQEKGSGDMDATSSFVGQSGGGTGRSLEGTKVTETDPLDMSEEAKAERWFKRVAQIKDISELSEIPDEDFPSIMPMRKGVNRFVVSKRKTPLERRLTSPQYRKNLRIMSSERKREGDDDN